MSVLKKHSLASDTASSAAAADRTIRRSKQTQQEWPVPVPSRAELACAFAQALDLAEGKQPGHAARVCYIALNLAGLIELPVTERRTLYFAALLHDAGAAPATAAVCRELNIAEETIFGGAPGVSAEETALQIAPLNAEQMLEAIRSHPKHGARVAEALGFDTAVQEAIIAHHERWDGEGYPNGQQGEEIAAAGRLIAAADLIEALISTDLNPLVARRNVASGLAEHAGSILSTELAQEAQTLMTSDSFWLGLHQATMPHELAASLPEDPAAAERSPVDAHTFASTFAALGDAKGEHTGSHSKRTAEIADEIAEALSFTDGRRELLRVAATAHDVGLLGVPARVIAKPDILSLAEMEVMRKHPTYSQLIIDALPGLEEIGRWVGAHHERPDGKGYPEMLDVDATPIEARIVTLADTYVALTSVRPYRKALSHKDALKVLQGGAGSQLDKKLVKLFCSLQTPARSSQTAQHSGRKR